MNRIQRRYLQHMGIAFAVPFFILSGRNTPELITGNKKTDEMQMCAEMNRTRHV